MTLFEALTFYNTLIENETTGEYSYDYKSAFEIFEKLHNESKDKDAQYYLYECYKYGRGVRKNISRAEKFQDLSINQNCSKAICELAITTANIYNDGEFDNEEEQIDILAAAIHTFEKAIEADSSNSKAKYELAYFLFNVVLPISDTSTQQYKDTYKKMFALLNSASQDNYPNAIFMLGDLINKSRASNTELSISNAATSYPRFYLKAAKYGCMHSLVPICEMFFEKKEYDTMTWWYWWARKYDKNYKNETFDEIIKSDIVLSIINKYMCSRTFYKIAKNSNDSRLYEEVHKMWFVNAYHDGILLSDLVPYYSVVVIPITFDKSKSAVYNYIISHINATKKSGTDSTFVKTVIEPLNNIKIYSSEGTPLTLKDAKAFHAKTI